MSETDAFVRNEYAVAMSQEHALLVARPGLAPRVVRGLDGESGSRLWQALASPISASKLAEASGLDLSALHVVLDALMETGVVVPSGQQSLSSGEPQEARAGTRSSDRLVLGVCGCAQAIFTPQVVNELLSGLTPHLDVILTHTAARLVSEEGLRTLGARVWTDTWQTSPESPVPHIEMARSAAMVLVLPASARSVFSLGNATCEDLLSLVVTATAAPVVIVPSMNVAMWTNPAVQENVNRCRRAGMTVVEPGFARRLSDDSGVQLLGGVGIGPSTPGLVALLESLMGAESSG